MGARVRLVLVGGLPGTGKSTLASGISSRTGWAVLRSDEVRKDIAGITHTKGAHIAFGEGLYDPQITKRTYEELLRRARALLEQDASVICDASWVSAEQRDAARKLAGETASDLVELCCVLESSVAAQRLRRRRTESSDASDADDAVAAAMAEGMDAWPEAVAISTDADPDRVVADVLTGPLGRGPAR